MPANAIPQRFERSWFSKGGSPAAEDAEYEVYAAICDGLDESWWVAPAAELHIERYRGHVDETELDLVLFNEQHGIVLLEVKSWDQVQVRGGRFVFEGPYAATKDPVKQLARHRQLLGEVIDVTLNTESGRRSIAFGLALPKLKDTKLGGITSGELPQGWNSEMLLGPEALSVGAVGQSVIGLLSSAPLQLEPNDVRTVVAELFPNQTFDYSPQGVIQMRRRRAAAVVRSELEVVETMDQNQRVLVTGQAGSGKSLLLTRWAERALDRGERVLVTCKGRPNAEYLSKTLGSREGLTVAPLLDLLADDAALPANPNGSGFRTADDVNAYWSAQMEIFQEHFRLLQPSYDTIVVDEIQDLEPWCRPILEHLVSTSPFGRILSVGDNRQTLDFQPRDLNAIYGDWAMASLPRNHRSPAEVQVLLEKVAMGPLTLEDFLEVDPTGDIVTFYEATSPVDDPSSWWSTVLGAIEAQYRHYVKELDVPNDQVAILTTSKTDQLDLVDKFTSSGWEGHVDGYEIIETANMVKGMEYQAVILVPNAANPTPLRPQLISGMSRAYGYLTVISPDPVIGPLDDPTS